MAWPGSRSQRRRLERPLGRVWALLALAATATVTGGNSSLPDASSNSNSVPFQMISPEQQQQIEQFLLNNLLQDTSFLPPEQAASFNASTGVAEPSPGQPSSQPSGNPANARVILPGSAGQDLSDIGTGTPTLCGNGVCDGGENCGNCAQDCYREDGVTPCRRVGMMYSVGHYLAWNVYRGMADAGHDIQTLESVLQGHVEGPNGLLSGTTYEQIFKYVPQSLLPTRSTQMQTPIGGLYCVYRRRQPGAINYNPKYDAPNAAYNMYKYPDCPLIRQTLLRHAQVLVAAGIDHIAVDLTSLPYLNTFEYFSILRPFEVLVEEWAALRQLGIQTPDIAVWQRLPQDPKDYARNFGVVANAALYNQTTPLLLSQANYSNLIYPYHLNYYNTPEYDRMFLRNSPNGQKLFLYPNQLEANSGDIAKGIPPLFDPAILADIEKDGTILAMPMWAYLYTQGYWNFLSQCQGYVIDQRDTPCNQPYTKNATVVGGTQVSVSPAYMFPYSSITTASAGSWQGVTLVKQFQRTWQLQPDYVMISNFNEFSSHPIAFTSPRTGPDYFNMGFESDSSPSLANSGFVDEYAAAFSRDLEPTLEGVTNLMDIVASCIRIFRYALRGCDDPTELCCQVGSFSERYAYVGTALDGTFGIVAVAGIAKHKPLDKVLPLYQCSRPAPPSPPPRGPPLRAPPKPPPAAPPPPLNVPIDVGDSGDEGKVGVSGDDPTLKPTPKRTTELTKKPTATATGSHTAVTHKKTTQRKTTQRKTTRSKTTQQKTTQKKTTTKKKATKKQKTTAKRKAKTTERHKKATAKKTAAKKTTKKKTTKKKTTKKKEKKKNLLRRAGRRLQAGPAPGPFFYSLDPKCEGLLPNPFVAQWVGSISNVKGDIFLRTLRRCVSADGTDVTRYALSGPKSCPPGYTPQVVLGYVR